MNTALKQNELCLTSSPTLRFIGGVTDRKAFTLPEVLSLEEMLDQIGPFPKGSLFFGQAEDDLPVLLDLSDPLPGPILIAGDAGAGKTRLLQVIARFIVSTSQPEDIQYGVITSRLHEWKDRADFPHCVGIFAMDEKSAVDFIEALAIWIGMKNRNSQSVLLLIDSLDEFIELNRAVGDETHQILADGPAKRIWPIVTMDPNRYTFSDTWLKYFHTRVFGYTSCMPMLDEPNDPSTDFESLARGIEFSVKTRSRQIKFRIPRI